MKSELSQVLAYLAGLAALLSMPFLASSFLMQAVSIPGMTRAEATKPAGASEPNKPASAPAPAAAATRPVWIAPTAIYRLPPADGAASFAMEPKKAAAAAKPKKENKSEKLAGKKRRSAPVESTRTDDGESLAASFPQIGRD